MNVPFDNEPNSMCSSGEADVTLLESSKGTEAAKNPCHMHADEMGIDVTMYAAERLWLSRVLLQRNGRKARIYVDASQLTRSHYCTRTFAVVQIEI